MTVGPAATTPALPTLDPRPLAERLADLRLSEGDDPVEAGDRLLAAGLGDGLPVVPPTAARIARMLGSTAAGSSEGQGPLPPGFVVPTAWDAAVCSVLAGCRPGVLPLVMAGLSATADPDFNLLGIQTTTGAAAPIFVVNGPIVGELGLNATHNALGGGWLPNATIGRALRLTLQIVGLAVPGQGDMATHGHPGKYTWLVAEHEGASPWPSLAESCGVAPGESSVTVLGGVGNVEVVLPMTSPEALVQTLAHSMTITGNLGRGHFGSGQPLVLLPPECAEFLDRHGWRRRDLQQALWGEATMPLGWLTAEARERVEDARAERGLPPTESLSAARSAEDIIVVVTGGVGVKATFVPTWGGGTEAITRSVMSQSAASQG